MLSKASRPVLFLAPSHHVPQTQPSRGITEVTFPRVNLMGREDDLSLPSVALQRLPGAIFHSPYASWSTAPLILNKLCPCFIINLHTSTCPSIQYSPEALTHNYKESTAINARSWEVISDKRAVLDKKPYFGTNKDFVHRPEYTASGIQIALVMGCRRPNNESTWLAKTTQIDYKLYTLLNKISLQNQRCDSESVWRECQETVVFKVLQL